MSLDQLLGWGSLAMALIIYLVLRCMEEDWLRRLAAKLVKTVERHQRKRKDI